MMHSWCDLSSRFLAKTSLVEKEASPRSVPATSIGHPFQSKCAAVVLLWRENKVKHAPTATSATSAPFCQGTDGVALETRTMQWCSIATGMVSHSTTCQVCRLCLHHYVSWYTYVACINNKRIGWMKRPNQLENQENQTFIIFCLFYSLSNLAITEG